MQVDQRYHNAQLSRIATNNFPPSVNGQGQPKLQRRASPSTPSPWRIISRSESMGMDGYDCGLWYLCPSRECSMASPWRIISRSESGGSCKFCIMTWKSYETNTDWKFIVPYCVKTYSASAVERQTKNIECFCHFFFIKRLFVPSGLANPTCALI